MDCNILISIHPSVITVWQGSSRTKKNKKWIRHKFFNFCNYFLVAGRAALSNVRSLLNVSQRWSARRARTQFPCCWPPDRVLRIINHIPQFTPSSWGRPGDIMSACDWLPAVFVCEKEKKKRERKIKRSVVMRFQPLPGTAHSCNLKFPSYHQTCRYPVPQLYLSWTLSGLWSWIEVITPGLVRPLETMRATGEADACAGARAEACSHTESVGGAMRSPNTWTLDAFSLCKAELCATGDWRTGVLSATCRLWSNLLDIHPLFALTSLALSTDR